MSGSSFSFDWNFNTAPKLQPPIKALPVSLYCSIFRYFIVLFISLFSFVQCFYCIVGSAFWRKNCIPEILCNFFATVIFYVVFILDRNGMHKSEQNSHTPNLKDPQSNKVAGESQSEFFGAICLGGGADMSNECWGRLHFSAFFFAF